ncbi:hypothetical protein [Streptomyces hokutonensis]|uniref:CPBP family intramembrane metalloprotease n=1 Tax=Streptomyces hokutonensis TaxID=1306990 RepID=A0ABW6M9N1_9ACTN
MRVRDIPENLLGPSADSSLPAPLTASSVRRVAVHVAGLLLLSCYWPLASGMVAVCAMYDVRWSRQGVLWLALGQLAVAVVVFFWLSWLVIARTTLDRVPNRSRLLQRGATVLAAAAVVYLSVPVFGAFVWSVGLTLFGCAMAWLAFEVARSHGVPLGARPPATPVQRFHDWTMARSTFFVCLAGGASTSLLVLIVRWAAIDGIPVVRDGQLSALGIGSVGNLALKVLWAVAFEDVVIVAATTALLTALRRPAWEIYTLICVLEVALHAYFGLPAIGMALHAAGRVWLYRRSRRLLPLMAGHAAFDLSGGALQLLSKSALYRPMLALPAVVALTWIGRRLETAAARDMPEAAPKGPAPEGDFTGPQDPTKAGIA